MNVTVTGASSTTWLDDMIQRVIRREREECAKLAERMGENYRREERETASVACDEVALAIRARSEKGKQNEHET